MSINITDIILTLLIFYLVFFSINDIININKSYKHCNSMFDLFSNKESIENPKDNKDIKINEQIESNDKINNNITESKVLKNQEIENNNNNKNINSNYNKYQSNIIDTITKKGDIITDRYSNLKDFKHNDNDLTNILIYNDIINNVDNLVDNLMDQDLIETNNINTIDNLLLDADTKIYNKCKKNQKLYKDAKTIAARFNKNSLLNSYNTEINYYENLRTPWWSEN